MRSDPDNSQRSNYWAARSSSWSRRRFLGGAAGVSAALASASLVGCGGGSSSNSPAATTGTGPSGQAATPKRGGTLHLVSSDNPATFDLHSNISAVTTTPMAPMFNKLVRMNPSKDGEIIPDLATALPEQPDPQTYVFHLTPNVKFSNGAVLTADDVKANYEWMISPPAGKVSTRQSILAPVVDKVDAVDATTVRFTLKQPSASFMINQVVEYMAIGPKSVLVSDGDLSKNPVGTGPFLKKSFTPGVSFELERNPNYFMSDRPYLDGMVIHIISDHRTALEQFFAGGIHMFQATANDIPEINQRMKDAIQVPAPTNARDTLFLMTAKPPFNDIRVRQAISLAADRGDHLQLVYQGLGNPVGGYMAPLPAGKWSLPEAKIRAIPGYDKSDLAQAKQLLAQAGVAPGTEIKVVNRSISPDLGTYADQVLRNLGLKSNAQSLDSAAAYANGDAGDFQLKPWATVPALDDPDAVFGDYGAETGAVRNWGRYIDPQIDSLYKQQSSELDAQKRLALVNQLDLIHLSNFVTINLGYSQTTFVQNKIVQNKTYQLNENYTNRQYDIIWLNG